MNVPAIVSAIQSRYIEIERSGNDEAAEWRPTPHTFKRTEADAFFVGVLFDKQQEANRAWEGGTDLVDNHFHGKDGEFSWATVSRTSINKVKQVMSSGWSGKAYHRFPNRHAEFLKENARIIVNRYDGDVRNIWAVSSEQVDLIYERFLEFKGISHALARMAQFFLVRKYGIAGGIESKRFMRVKADVHLRRVSYRLGLVQSRTPCAVAREFDALNLESQADIDLVLYRTGQEYCHKTAPKCAKCPLVNACARRGVS